MSGDRSRLWIEQSVVMPTEIWCRDGIIMKRGVTNEHGGSTDAQPEESGSKVNTSILDAYELLRLWEAGEYEASMPHLDGLVEAIDDQGLLKRIAERSRAHGFQRTCVAALRKLATIDGTQHYDERADQLATLADREDQPRLNAIVTLLRSGDHREAQVQLEEAKSASRENPIWHLLAGDLLIRSGDLSEGVEAIHNAAGRVDDARQLQRISQVLAQAGPTADRASVVVAERLQTLDGDDKNAERLERLHKRMDNRTNAYQISIVRHLRNEEMAEAREALASARAEFPSVPEWSLLEAELAIRENRPRDAAAALVTDVNRLTNAAQTKRILNVAGRAKATEAAALLAERLSVIDMDDDTVAERAERLTKRRDARKLALRNAVAKAFRESDLAGASKAIECAKNEFYDFPEMGLMQGELELANGNADAALEQMRAALPAIEDTMFLRRRVNAIAKSKVDACTLATLERLVELQPDDQDLLDRMLLVEGRMMRV